MTGKDIKIRMPAAGMQGKIVFAALMASTALVGITATPALAGTCSNASAPYDIPTQTATVSLDNDCAGAGGTVNVTGDVTIISGAPLIEDFAGNEENWVIDVNTGVTVENGGVGAAIQFRSPNGSVVNSGTVENSSSGSGIYFISTAGAGSVVNNAGATITGNTGSAIAFQAGGTVVNDGTISSNSGTAISSTGGALNLTNTGTIQTSGDEFDSGASGSAGGTIDNSGTINGRLNFFGSGTVDITNSGSITGVANQVAIRVNGIAGTIVNSGTITTGGGTATTAIEFSGGNDMLELQPGSSISGNVLAGSGTDTLKFGGTVGSQSFDLNDIGAGQQYQNFETFVVDSLTSNWDFTGTTSEDFSVSGGIMAIGAGGATFGDLTLETGGEIDIESQPLNVSSFIQNGGTVEDGTINASTAYQLSGGTFDATVGNTTAVSVVGGGTVTLGTSAVLNSGGSLSISGGTIFDLGTTTQAVNGFTLTDGTVENGILSAASYGLVNGVLDVTIGNNNTLLVTGGGSVALGTSAGLSAGGDLAIDGASTLDLGNTSQTVHDFTMLNGTVENGTLSALGYSLRNGVFDAIVGNTNAVTVEGGGSVTLGTNAVLDGGGTVLVQGVSTLDLGGTNQSVYAIGLLDGTISNGTLNATGGYTVGNGEISANLTGAVGLNKSLTGTVTLSGTNSYTGGTAVTAGTLIGDTDSLQGDITDDATLVFNQISDGTYAGVVSGSGSLTKDGAGALTLTADSSGFAGNTELDAGSLFVNGQLGGGLTVNAGVLGGTGTVGDVVVNAGTIAPGESPGTLTIAGDLVLSSGSVLDFELGDPSGTAGVNSDLIDVGGNLTLDGTLDVTDAGDFGAGLYRLVNYGGTLADNGLDVGSVPSGFSATDLAVQTAMAGQVNLLVTSPIMPLTFWNGIVTSADGSIHGGSGTWDVTTTNWTDPTGSSSGPYDPTGFLIFAGDPGSVTVDGGAGDIAVQTGMQFAVDGYTVAGDDILLDGAATIRVGDGTAAGSAYAATIASNLTGTGSLEKTDLGTLILAGTNSYTGGTTISDGTLLVNGSIGGTLDILGGGTLGGSGTVGTMALASGGILVPGNSIGTLNVAGAIFNAGSVYEVELNDGGFIAGTNNDLLAAAGAVTIDGGTVHVTPENGTDTGTTYTLGTYTIITAGSLTGQFDSVTDDYAFLDFTDTYDVNNAYLTSVLTATSFCLDGYAVNQCATGDGAFSLGGGGLFTAVLNLSDAEAPIALDQLSGEIHASTKTALIEDSRFAREAALNRLHGAKQAAEGKTGLWMQGFGSWGSWDSGGNAAELDRSIGGLFFGGDALVMDGVRLGLFGGYSDSSFDVDERNSSGSAESWHLGAYAGAEAGNLALRLGGAYSWHDLTSARSVAFMGFSDSLTASYSARTGQIFGEAGYSFDTGAVSLEPFANFAYVHLKTDGFTETGGAAALTASDQSTDATFSTIGLRAETGLDLGETPARLTGMAGWRHAFDDVTPFATHAFAGGSAFTVAGAPIAPDALVLDLGASVELTPGATLGISYGGQFGSGFTDHGVKANLAVRF